MRVLVDGSRAGSSRKTGIGYYTWNLLAALAESPEVERLGVARGARVVDVQEFLNQQVDGRRAASPLSRLRRFLKPALPLARVVSDWRRARLLRRASRQGPWSVFHETNYVSPELDLRLVTTVCDLCFLRCPEHVPADRRRWLARRLQPCLERSAAIVTISNFVREELLEQFPALDPSRVFATPLGVDRQRFRNNAEPAAIAELRARWRLPENYLLFLGTREPRKNLQGLLAAFLTLPAAMRRAFPLVLAGVSGWHEHHFRDLIERLEQDGSLRVIGYVPAPDVPLLLQAATACCFPSFYEGFGLPPLEAAACGTPVLCSRAGALPEVMGEAALYVDPYSVDAMSDGLRRLLADSSLQSELRTRGLQRAEQFTWSACAAATLAAYRVAS